MVHLRRYQTGTSNVPKHTHMTDSNMPAAEAEQGMEQDLQAYELAFHVLPTVAEGEVKKVFDSIKEEVTKLGGTVSEEEAPARFDLAYDIVKFLEGKHRKFSSAYFGWVRFTLDADQVGTLTGEVDRMKDVLRSLLIRLTKTEDANPFYFHPAIASRVVETIDIAEVETPVEAEAVVEDVVLEEKVEDGEAIKETV